MQGTRIRQKANGQQVRLLFSFQVISFQSAIPTQQRPDLPSSPSPASGVFSQPLSGTRKDQACQNQGSVFNIIMTGIKTVNITQNQREERRTSLGQVWGEETNPAVLSDILGSYRNPLVSTLGAQAAETPCPTQGSWAQVQDLGQWCCLGECGSVSPGAGDCVGLSPSTWVRILYPETTHLPFTCRVSCPLGDSQRLK